MNDSHTTPDAAPLSRRLFLQRLGVAAGAGVFLSACGPESAETGEAAPEMAEEGFSCLDTTGLTDMEVQMRQTLAYVDESPFPEKLCNNCQFWQPAATEGQCGGCQLLKGPIHPQGYCNSWAPMQEPAS